MVVMDALKEKLLEVGEHDQEFLDEVLDDDDDDRISTPPNAPSIDAAQDHE